MEEKLYLFSYGTLQSRLIQKILFDVELTMEPALLKDWRLYEDIDDYYFIREEKGYEVKGQLLELTKEQFWIVDQWEEIPSYTRKKVSIDSIKKGEVYVYVRQDSTGTPVDEPKLSSKEESEILEFAKAHRNLLQHNQLKYIDFYILIPCSVESLEESSLKKQNSFADYFLNKYSIITNEEFNSKYMDSLKRRLLDQVFLQVNLKNDERYVQEQLCNVYLTEHEESSLGVLTIALPATLLSIPHVQESLLNGSLKFRDVSLSTSIPIYQWMDKQGLKIHGKARTAIFSPENIEEDILINLFVGESCLLGKITEPKFIEMARTNLAQYDTAKIYSSDWTLVEISSNFEDNYNERIDNHILTLFVIELLLFQDGAISKVDAKIEREITEQRYNPYRKNSMDVIEELLLESTKSIMFWNPRNFIYPVAESLANRISNAFGLEKMLGIQEKNKVKLEQLINIHYVKMSEQENKSTNALLLLLALIQVIPTFYLISISIFKHKLAIADYLSAVISFISVILIYLIFQRKKPWKRNIGLLRDSKIDK